MRGCCGWSLTLAAYELPGEFEALVPVARKQHAFRPVHSSLCLVIDLHKKLDVNTVRISDMAR